MRRQSCLAALIGSGVGPSLTPPLHEREGTRQGIGYVYRTVDIDALGMPPDAVVGVIDSARKLGFDGLNITHPCKQLVLDHLDSLAPDVEALGSVNTIVFRAGEAVGYNTDKAGFERGFRLGLPNASVGHVVLIGAGGAGSAVAHALLNLGADHIDVFDLDQDRAGAVAASLRSGFGVSRASARRLSDEDELRAELRVADGLVHATPKGMAAHPGLSVSKEWLRSELWVAEVVYRPLETELVRAARERGCRVLDGGRMAVFQAVESFGLFTGLEPDADRMLRHFNELVTDSTVRKGGDTHVGD